MARPLRIEYPGAIYHVISRGNYRKDLFTVGESGKAFEKALMECGVRCGWKLHAYVIMSNHYHLCLETPEGNLVDGMRWLQGTFGNRFNRHTGERGHVFQGRYKALLVDEGDWLVSLVNYIHLNPVRAGLLGVDDLKDYALSSFPKFFRRKPTETLERARFLSELGLKDSVGGMKKYHQRIALAESVNVDDHAELEKQLTRGWVIASSERRKEIAKELGSSLPIKRQGVNELRELHEAQWNNVLITELKRTGKNEGDIVKDRKLSKWKIEVARVVKRETMASNPWVAQRLNMGDPSNVSRYTSNRIPKTKD